jgi:hypothetical protein
MTAYNFLVVNVFQNRSADFGTEPFSIFLLEIVPMAFGPIFTVLLYVIALPLDLYVNINKRKMPAVLIFTVFYFLVISLVPHKESRFMLPVMPFLFLMLAQAINFI